MTDISVILEIGQKRVFATAADWPGWSRAGNDETSALQALADYAPRYALALAGSGFPFSAPPDASAYGVIERLPGGAATDFGVPEVIPAGDHLPAGPHELLRYSAILQACWQTFLRSARQAEGASLRTGPRGGGRDLGRLTRHVLDAQAAYLSKIGWKQALKDGPGLEETILQYQQAVLDGFAACARGELPRQGPRGGQYWPARYFARRSAWHILDHAWEIEDRRTG